MIDELRKIILIHLEKTGGTSIAIALFGKDEGAKRKGSDLAYDNGLTKHYSITKAKQVYGNEKWTSYTKITVIRNPWDRLVSKWFWRKEGCERKKVVFPFPLDGKGKIPKAWFAKEIEEECSRWQLKNPDDFLFGTEKSLVVDYILRFESLDHDWKEFSSKMGLTGIGDLPHINKSATRETDYRIYFTDETAEFVRRHFERTVAYFNYAF
jgi:hypothetical protein